MRKKHHTAAAMSPDIIPVSCLASSLTWMQKSVFSGQTLLLLCNALECYCHNASKTIYLPDVNRLNKSAEQVSLYHWNCFSALQIIKPFIVIWLKSAAFNCLVNYASLLALEVKHRGECTAEGYATAALNLHQQNPWHLFSLTTLHWSEAFSMDEAQA